MWKLHILSITSNGPGNALSSCHTNYLVHINKRAWHKLRSSISISNDMLYCNGLPTPICHRSYLVHINKRAWHKLRSSTSISNDMLYCNGLPTPIPFIITTWRGISCRIAIISEGISNPYLLSNVHISHSTGGELSNGVNGFLTSYATDSVRVLQQILDKEHAGRTNELIRWQIWFTVNRFVKAYIIDNIA